MLITDFEVDSPNVRYTADAIEAQFEYDGTELSLTPNKTWLVTPRTDLFQFRTLRTIPKLGVMLVGLGGNNGSTLVAGILANKNGVTWVTKEGLRKPNYWGSVTQASTVHLGSMNGEEVYAPFKALLPMVDPNDLVVGGWDISSYDLADAMERARVLDIELQQQLAPLMKDIVPLPGTRPLPSCFARLLCSGIYDQSFVAANQKARADNVIEEKNKADQVKRIQQDIRSFKSKHQLDQVIVLWTANTERYASVEEGLNNTMEALLESVDRNESEIAPSTLYAIAAIKEGVPFINGSPQNTFVPGLIDMATRRQVFIGGDDFKSGQTKVKSVLIDFMVGAGIKPVSIVSYNHLGNNDGLNLSAPQTFRSKEISKSNVVDDMVASNRILYEAGEHPDHVVVIKHVPYVGDSKRAMDEYTSEIFLGGRNTFVIHNTCEDSLLAAPIILDLVLLTELMTRIKVKRSCESAYQSLHPVASLLSYLTKAPMVPDGTPVVNALAKQRAMLENFMRACVGLRPENNMMLEQKLLGPKGESRSSMSKEEA